MRVSFVTHKYYKCGVGFFFLYMYVCIMSAILSESDSLTNSIELQAMFSSLSFHSWSLENRRAIYPVIYKFVYTYVHICMLIYSAPL